MNLVLQQSPGSTTFVDDKQATLVQGKEQAGTEQDIYPLKKVKDVTGNVKGKFVYYIWLKQD